MISSALFSKLTESVLPYTCLLCQSKAKDYDLCAHCLQSFPRIENPCLQCGFPLSFNHSVCGRCQSEPPDYDRTMALFSYQDPLPSLISQFKFHQKLFYGALFGFLFAQALQKNVQEDLPEVLIPVPLHSSRLSERGYNQALELAGPISRLTKIPLESQILIRTRATAQQATLIQENRQKNVKKAFEVRKKLSYSHVGLVDDVMTTGHTLNECARVLKLAGVQKVTLLVIARTCLSF